MVEKSIIEPIHVYNPTPKVDNYVPDYGYGDGYGDMSIQRSGTQRYIYSGTTALASTLWESETGISGYYCIIHGVLDKIPPPISIILGAHGWQIDQYVQKAFILPGQGRVNLAANDEIMRPCRVR